MLRIGKRHVLPFLSAVFLLWFGIGATSHFLFNVFDSTGLFCHGTDVADLERLRQVNDHSSKVIIFPTNALCFATGVYLEQGARYSVTIVEDTPWAANALPQAHPSGFRTAELSAWRMVPTFAALPLRRVLFRPWFRVIARVGAAGISEEFLGLGPVHISDNEYRGVTEAAVGRDGELFLYVNDAVIGLPWFTDAFYRNNRGTARIIVTRL